MMQRRRGCTCAFAFFHDGHSLGNRVLTRGRGLLRWNVRAPRSFFFPSPFTSVYLCTGCFKKVRWKFGRKLFERRNRRYGKHLVENNSEDNYGSILFAFFGRVGFRIYIQVTDRSLRNTWYTSTLSIWCLVRLNGIEWRSMASSGAKGNANVFVMLPG